MNTLRALFSGFAAAAALVALAPDGHATPRPLAFTYPHMTLPKGKFEVEQYVDLVPVRLARELPTGDEESIVSFRSVLQTELEFGLTDRLEGALYFAFRQNASQSPSLRFDGLKQRLRYRFADTGEWPVDVGVYFEVAEFHNEVELEEKLLLSRRFGPLTVNANLWFEQERYFQDAETKYIYNPTAGASYELSPAVALGLEYWARGRFDSKKASVVTAAGADSNVPSSGTRHYAGPTFLVQSGELFVGGGAYLRLDHLNRSVPVGDDFGRVWVRLLVGVGL